MCSRHCPKISNRVRKKLNTTQGAFNRLRNISCAFLRTWKDTDAGNFLSVVSLVPVSGTQLWKDLEMHKISKVLKKSLKNPPSLNLNLFVSALSMLQCVEQRDERIVNTDINKVTCISSIYEQYLQHIKQAQRSNLNEISNI